MRAAAARAASRRGSSRMRRLPFAHGSSRSASGARVVLPAPGGATSTAFECAASAECRAGSASSIGRGAATVMCASFAASGEDPVLGRPGDRRDQPGRQTAPQRDRSDPSKRPLWRHLHFHPISHLHHSLLGVQPGLRHDDRVARRAERFDRRRQRRNDRQDPRHALFNRIRGRKLSPRCRQSRNRNGGAQEL